MDRFGFAAVFGTLLSTLTLQLYREEARDGISYICLPHEVASWALQGILQQTEKSLSNSIVSSFLVGFLACLSAKPDLAGLGIGHWLQRRSWHDAITFWEQSALEVPAFFNL